MKFEKVFVIGTGTIACNCARLIKSKYFHVSLIEGRIGDLISSKQFCELNNIEFFKLTKDEITSFFSQLEERTLIISASNRYLFPSEILRKDNLEIINFHGALLPDFPGRNAEAWAIYSGKEYGGITWHKVVEQVDAGDILVQQKVSITDKTTSFTLLREYTRVAFTAFESLIDSLLVGQINYTKQSSPVNDKLYYSWERPNNAFCDFDWSGSEISRFLRAMDYGPLQTLGPIFLDIDGIIYSCLKFKVKTSLQNVSKFELNTEDNRLEVERDGYHFDFEDLKETSNKKNE